MTFIQHSKPWLTEADIEAVNKAIRSGMIGQGEKTSAFELSLSQWFGIDDGGIAVGSGAAALVMALSALGVKSGDEVILPTYVCSSVLEVVFTIEAIPVLCDVGDEWVVKSENMSDYINKRTKAIIVPHMYGVFADVSSFREFGVPIIEDCAQALDYKKRRKISGDIAMFSFHPTKCLTTGEGGMAVSENSDLLTAMRSFRDGNVLTNKARLFSPMSDISAVLGLYQLSRYHEALDRRQYIAHQYIDRLTEVVPNSLMLSAYENSMFFRFPIVIEGGLDKFQGMFAKKGICVRRGVDKLLHHLMHMPDDKYKTSLNLFNKTISLPIYPAMTDDQIVYCIEAAVEILSVAS